MTNIINTIIEKLKKYPEIKINKISDTEIEIPAIDENGFSIYLVKGSREYTLHLGQIHSHHEEIDYELNEMFDNLYLGLSGNVRIKQFSKKGKPYKWILQEKDQNDNWHDDGNLGFLNFNFWTKPKIKYFQNNHIIPKLI